MVTPVATVVAEVESRLRAEGARAAALYGSVGRGDATDESDIDILVVTAGAGSEPDPVPFERTFSGSRLVEIARKSYAGWVAHLGGPYPRWVWSLVEPAPVLFDDGSLADLRRRSHDLLATFVTPAEVKAELATMLWHSRPKLARAAASPETAAYWAALVVPTLVDGLLAVHNRPTVPGSLRMDVLRTVPLDPADGRLVTLALTGHPHERLVAVRELASTLADRLGPPDLERLSW